MGRLVVGTYDHISYGLPSPVKPYPADQHGVTITKGRDLIRFFVPAAIDSN